MDIHKIKDALFELGEALQDTYIALEYNHRREAVELGRKLKDALAFLRELKCTLHVTAKYCYMRPQGVEWSFETETDWSDLEEVEHSAYLGITLNIDGTKGHVEISKGSIDAGFYRNIMLNPDEDDPNKKGDKGGTPPEGGELAGWQESDVDFLRKIGIKPLEEEG
ncbi:MAG: hypothetical protein Q8Q41_01420 [bacterium]|nr:hypothetical protein [bacterium]